MSNLAVEQGKSARNVKLCKSYIESHKFVKIHAKIFLGKTVAQMLS